MLFALLLSCCATPPVSALDADVRLADFHHTIWTAKDGAPAEITSLAQTSDGWLWLGTPSGMYRFDGVRFERYQPPAGSDLPSNRIGVLLAADNGDLWIGYAVGGVSVRRADGRLAHLDRPGGAVGPVQALALDTDGSAWAAALNGLFHLVDGTWRRIGAEAGLPGARATQAMFDQYGQLWASNGEHLYRRDRSGGHFREQQADCSAAGLIMSPDGRLWCARDGHVDVVPSPAASATPRPRPPRHTQGTGQGSGLFDRDGNLWTLACPRGLCLLPRADRRREMPLVPQTMAADRFDQPWQMSSLSAWRLLEDREGNIWVGTQAGLERFRNPKVIPVRVPDVEGYFTLASNAPDTMWAANVKSHALWRLPLDGPPEEMAGQHYRNIAGGRAGTLLLSGRRALEIRGPGGAMQFPYPVFADGPAVDFSARRIVDDGVRIWCQMAGHGLYFLHDGAWAPAQSLGLPAQISLHAAGGPGQLWFTDLAGRLSLYDNGRIRGYPSTAGAGVGTLSGLFAGDHLVLAGEKGVAVLVGDRYRRLLAGNPDVLDDVTGLVGANGDYWLNGAKGVLRIHQADWRRALDGAPLRYELIDALDGYPGQAVIGNWIQSAHAGPDGQLWFMTTLGIVRIDPRKRQRNRLAPPVEIQYLHTDGARYPSAAGLALPPGVSSLRVDYTALSYTKPERVRFRYRLDGVDRDWQDAGGRRSAYYTNLGPGDYRFSVMASNEDGVAGAPASVAFSLAPSPLQTWWFKLLTAAAALLVLWLLYRWRLRRVSALIHLRLNDRQAERERIARDLHDTLLQSVQGMILTAHAASLSVPERTPVRQMLDEMVSQANEAMAEGRDRVQVLRARSYPPASLADALEGVGQRHAPQGVAFMLRSQGEARALHPVVQDELFNIGRECLLNAFRHAGARRVEINLHHDRRALRLTIRDDGAGLPPEVAEARGRDGHWGIAGLYERAHKIKAQLDLRTAPGGGTAWHVSVPARLAYLRQRRPPFWRRLAGGAGPYH